MFGRLLKPGFGLENVGAVRFHRFWLISAVPERLKAEKPQCVKNADFLKDVLWVAMPTCEIIGTSLGFDYCWSWVLTFSIFWRRISKQSKMEH